MSGDLKVVQVSHDLDRSNQRHCVLVMPRWLADPVGGKATCSVRNVGKRIPNLPENVALPTPDLQKPAHSPQNANEARHPLTF